MAVVDYLSIIDKLREARGWSEYKLAKESGIPQSTISSWYCGKKIPKVTSLEKICNAFGITLSELFYEGNGRFSLTENQRRLLENWPKLTNKKQKAVLDLMEE